MVNSNFFLSSLGGTWTYERWNISGWNPCNKIHCNPATGLIVGGGGGSECYSCLSAAPAPHPCDRPVLGCSLCFALVGEGD